MSIPLQVNRRILRKMEIHLQGKDRLVPMNKNKKNKLKANINSKVSWLMLMFEINCISRGPLRNFMKRIFCIFASNYQSFLLHC